MVDGMWTKEDRWVMVDMTCDMYISVSISVYLHTG